MGRSRQPRLPLPDDGALITRTLWSDSEALRTAESWVRRRIYGLEKEQARALYELYLKNYREVAGTLTMAYSDDGKPVFARRAILLEQMEREINALIAQAEAHIDTALIDAYEQGYAGRAWVLDQATNPNIPIRFRPVLPAQAIRSLLLQPMMGRDRRYMGQDWHTELGFAREEFVLRTKRSLTASMVQGEGIGAAMRRLRDEYGIQTDRRKGFTRNFYQTTMIARTEILRASNLGALAVYEENADILSGWEWTATKDERTCFPAWVRVETADGPRPIASLKPGDRVLTRAGYCSVLNVMRRRYAGRMVRVEAGNHQVVSTADHLFWSDGWKAAGTLTTGDKLQAVGNQPVEVCGVFNVALTEADNPPTALDKGGIALRILRGVLMPVIAVNFKGNRAVSKSEINRPAPDLELLSEGDAEARKALADGGLKGRFARERAIAAEATEGARISGANAEPFATVAAFGVLRRAAALFRAVDIVWALGSKRFATASARFVERSGGATSHATHVEAVGNTGIDFKLFVADRADLDHRCGGVCGVVALAAAILALCFAGRAHERPTTMRTGSGNLVRAFGLLPGVIALTGAVLTTLTVRALEGLAAYGTDAFKHALSISRAGKHYHIWVYDIEVDGHHEFYAEGLLVHNCPICGAMDGKRFKFNDPQLQPPSGSHPGCRCTIVPVLKDERLMNEVAGIRETYSEWAARNGMITDGGLDEQRGAAPPKAKKE